MLPELQQCRAIRTTIRCRTLLNFLPAEFTPRPLSAGIIQPLRTIKSLQLEWTSEGHPVQLAAMHTDSTATSGCPGPDPALPLKPPAEETFLLSPTLCCTSRTVPFHALTTNERLSSHHSITANLHRSDGKTTTVPRATRGFPVERPHNQSLEFTQLKITFFFFKLLLFSNGNNQLSPTSLMLPHCKHHLVS